MLQRASRGNISIPMLEEAYQLLPMIRPSESILNSLQMRFRRTMARLPKRCGLLPCVYVCFSICMSCVFHESNAVVHLESKLDLGLRANAVLSSLREDSLFVIRIRSRTSRWWLLLLFKDVLHNLLGQARTPRIHISRPQIRNPVETNKPNR